ncbi:MAG: DNA polymerase III subunit epsilon [Alphaproteobacteria bacterium]|nr:DNA polymerase III subunit epsilon [Alphaproteobacteria bacterium]
MREIVLDTETTGLSHENGDRIVDIGCVELINHVQTGNTYHVYINPEARKMHPDASAISGITDEFLADKPLFKDIVDDFLKFVDDSPLVIHNAKFDIGFLNSELARVNKPLFNLEDAIDTLMIARVKFPGAPVNLDALCKRFNVDTSIRVTHGALIDCFLLADVYINLLGGRQSDLSFSDTSIQKQKTEDRNKNVRPKRSFPPSEEELSAHAEFLKTLNDALWNKAS